ncbi:uncharacterized protein SPAPADRAFT_140608 [Spathaspora passalidarum NRRL Y-27907]|uniref:Jacalin-type lectin domain-containing protein n=1 Tax=Spathaspora passalidarum (strain NRRL Y-27907 / 11-Y1) TaxID=619300 RepID=G3AQF9_SPAPN|nr:uncharacterized protein SPAPADRAFT_140608 [Spathaspora passalidarum NRRL Y-27907]EGW31506.1 hypothetical protein SPAPADRAFT_140608 [Spathaspora passalidarum NRRL Y-27907]
MGITFNYRNDEIVSSPTVIVSGRTSTGIDQGLISFTNNNNKVFPPLYFEVNNNGNFKAVIHVAPGEPNVFKVEVYDNGYIAGHGFPEYRGTPRVLDSRSLTLVFNPLPDNKVVHLCLIKGRDSNGSFDMPGYKLNAGERPSVELAIKKLKVGARLMQAFTQEEMRINGFSNRCFQFAEEITNDQSIFGYNVKSPTPHAEVKIHVLTSPLSVAELRDPNKAQQNPNASDSGFTFSHAIDLVKQCPDIKEGGTSVQAACIYLDSTYDTKNDLILTHAALGGGTDEVAMAVFGSHGLHSWANNFARVTPCFLDDTQLSKREVANDCDECGTSWECYNITLGAFMHEIGHSLGCPHQVDGVMLRDYVWLNRSFMTRELQCLRRNTKGAVIGTNGKWDKECHWNRLDLMRFLYHDSFGLPIDQFEKLYTTTKRNDDDYNGLSAPSKYALSKDEIVVKSRGGIFLVEIITKDLARYSREFFPPFYGGRGLPTELKINYNEYLNELRRASKDSDDKYDVRILTTAGDLYISNFKEDLTRHGEIIRSDFGLNRGQLEGIKGELLGQSKDHEMHYVGFNIDSVYKVRVYSGMALDGFRFYFKSGGSQLSAAPKVPPRNYLKRFQEVLTLSDSSGGDDQTALVGNEKQNYSEYLVPSGEVIAKFHVRNGAWVDGIGFETNKGTLSPIYGNSNGGHLSIVETPSHDFKIVGIYSYMGGWIDGMGVIYAKN